MSAITNYADAVYRIASAEGETAEVEDELLRFSQMFESNEQLRSALTDPGHPVSLRQQVVEDLLKGKSSIATLSAVSMIVSAGRARDLPAIVRAMVDRSAAQRNRAVAEVRAAVPLSADQLKRLAAAIKKATGREVELKVTVDSSVLGGVVTRIGDTVIDGSVRHRLNKLREAMG